MREGIDRYMRSLGLWWAWICARVPHPALRATFPPGEGMGCGVGGTAHRPFPTIGNVGAAICRPRADVGIGPYDGGGTAHRPFPTMGGGESKKATPEGIPPGWCCLVNRSRRCSGGSSAEAPPGSGCPCRWRPSDMHRLQPRTSRGRGVRWHSALRR